MPISADPSTQPTVSIVVIGHSVRAELERCFGAVERHAGMPVEVILVDNASTDDTLAWVARAHPAVKVIPLERNINFGAREYGRRVARGRYMMFMDSDAALTEGALPTLVGALDEHRDWGLVGPRLVYDDGSLQLSCRRFPPLGLPLLRRPPLDRLFEGRARVQWHLMADFDYATTRPVLYMLGACILFRADLARAAGSFDSSRYAYWEDADWCFRIRDAGGEVMFIPAATVIHSYRRASVRDPVSLEALSQLVGFFRFQRRWWSRRRELIALSERLDA